MELIKMNLVFHSMKNNRMFGRFQSNGLKSSEIEHFTKCGNLSDLTSQRKVLHDNSK